MHTKPIRIYWAMGNMKAMPTRTDRGELLETTCRDYAKAVVAPGTEVTIGWMKKAGTSYNSIYLSMLNDAHVVRDILDAEASGYDAAMIGPHWDPGLYAAREAARIPVTGPCESAMMLAQTLGKRFAVVTTSDGIVPFIERNMRIYGCEARAISRKPVRPFGLGFDALIDALEGDGDEFLTRFTRTASALIDDGADVILAGGQLFGPVFTRHKYFSIPNTGVPVVEVAACGLKIAESLVALRRAVGLAKSEQPGSPFRSPERAEIDGVLKTFGLR
jgi:allantoin racemase